MRISYMTILLVYFSQRVSSAALLSWQLSVEPCYQRHLQVVEQGMYGLDNIYLPFFFPPVFCINSLVRCHLTISSLCLIFLFLGINELCNCLCSVSGRPYKKTASKWQNTSHAVQGRQSKPSRTPCLSYRRVCDSFLIFSQQQYKKNFFLSL